MGKIYSPGKALFFKEAKVFCIFNMYPINHCLWLAVLASARFPTTRVTFTLVSLKVCYLQVLCAYIINRNNNGDDLVKRPAAELQCRRNMRLRESLNVLSIEYTILVVYKLHQHT